MPLKLMIVGPSRLPLMMVMGMKVLSLSVAVVAVVSSLAVILLVWIAIGTLPDIFCPGLAVKLQVVGNGYHLIGPNGRSVHVLVVGK